MTSPPPVHAPPWHVSFCVHRFPSSQLDPFGLLVWLAQTPDVGLQVPGFLHWPVTAQTTGFPPVHVPDWHVSVCVHALLSLQDVPSAFGGFEQTPVPVLHVPPL